MIPHLAETTTLGDLLVRAAAIWPEADSVVFPEHRLTFSAWYRRAVHRARSLLALGVRPGSYVGLLMPNCIDMVEMMFGCQLVGAIAVPVNSRYRSAELEYVFGDAGLEVLVTTDLIAEHVDYVARIHEALPSLSGASNPTHLELPEAPTLRTVVSLGSGRTHDGMLTRDAFDEAADRVSPSRVEELRLRVRIRDVAIMIYTSGTTAHPKGCPLSHEALVRSGRAMSRVRHQLTDEDRVWDPLPMFHMSAIFPLTASLDAGAAFLSLTHFSVDAAIEQLVTERPTVLYPAFPTVTASLIEHRRWPEVDVSRVRLVINVAASDTLRRFQAAYPSAVQVSAYGLSEAGGVISFNELTDDLDTRVTTCGRPFPGIEVKVVEPDTLDELPAGERGEMWIRGYCLFEGYHNDPGKTAASVTTDGWLRTGDVCSLDHEGRIRYHGRIKDMLKVGGENVAAVEIESFLATHPAVKLAQVVGMPDDRLGEVVVAFVELAAGATATEEELVDFCRDRIASFKVPRRVVFVNDWPMSATKIQKFRLREKLMPEMEGS